MMCRQRACRRLYFAGGAVNAPAPAPVGDIPPVNQDRTYWRRTVAPAGRLAYRLFRSPVVLFGIGPIWSLMIGARFWTREMRPRQVHSVWLTDLVVVAMVGGLIAIVGPTAGYRASLPLAHLRDRHRPHPRRECDRGERRHGDELTAISDGLVALLKEFYGRGPTQAKSYYQDDLVVCMLRGGYTRVDPVF
jgi:hypothetical protein